MLRLVAVNESIDIVVKANQKHNIANYSLSLSYDLNNRMTTALLYGKFVLEKPKVTPGIKRTTQLTQLIARIRDMISFRAHPLQLPLAVLVNRFDRLTFYTTEMIDAAVLNIEYILGYTNADRLEQTQEDALYQARTTRSTSFSRVTGNLITMLTECISISR